MGCIGLGARVSHDRGMGHMTNRSIDRVLDWNPHYLMQNNHCTMLCYAAGHIESPWESVAPEGQQYLYSSQPQVEQSYRMLFTLPWHSIL